MVEKINSAISEYNSYAEKKSLSSRLFYSSKDSSLYLCTNKGLEEGYLYSNLVSSNNLLCIYEAVVAIKAVMYFEFGED